MFSNTDIRGKNIGDLETAAEAKAVDLIGLEAGDIGAMQMHAAGGRLVFSGDQIEQVRFTGTVRADDRMALALVDAVYDLRQAETLLQSAQLDYRSVHRATPS